MSRASVNAYQDTSNRTRWLAFEHRARTALAIATRLHIVLFPLDLGVVTYRVRMRSAGRVSIRTAIVASTILDSKLTQVERQMQLLLLFSCSTTLLVQFWSQSRITWDCASWKGQNSKLGATIAEIEFWQFVNTRSPFSLKITMLAAEYLVCRGKGIASKQGMRFTILNETQGPLPSTRLIDNEFNLGSCIWTYSMYLLWLYKLRFLDVPCARITCKNKAPWSSDVRNTRDELFDARSFPEPPEPSVSLLITACSHCREWLKWKVSGNNDNCLTLACCGALLLSRGGPRPQVGLFIFFRGKSSKDWHQRAWN